VVDDDDDDDDVKHTRKEEASHNTRSDEAVCHSAGYSNIIM
jgi:hypothetical protein